MSADDTPPGSDPEHPITSLDRRWQAVGERRAHLVTADNPAIAHDYLVEHRGRLQLRFSETAPPPPCSGACVTCPTAWSCRATRSTPT